MNMKRYQGAYAHQTDVGRVRITNEDQANALANEYGDIFLVVCDGMGGQNKGDYASKLAIDIVSSAFLAKKHFGLFPKLWLKRTIEKANRRIHDEAERSPEYANMGTTIVAALISGEKVIVANVGDSRAYSYSKEAGLKRLSRDQTYVEYLARTGQISQEETLTHKDRHVLMNALGIFPSAAMDIQVFPYQGEAILLCSDGFYNNLSEMEARAVLSTDERPDQKVKSLIIDANANGGSDNIGIAYWEAFHD